MERINAYNLRDNKEKTMEETGYLCPLCKDTGWLVSERGAYPCSCRKDKILELKKGEGQYRRRIKKY